MFLQLMNWRWKCSFTCIVAKAIKSAMLFFREWWHLTANIICPVRVEKHNQKQRSNERLLIWNAIFKTILPIPIHKICINDYILILYSSVINRQLYDWMNFHVKNDQPMAESGIIPIIYLGQKIFENFEDARKYTYYYKLWESVT